MAQSMTTIRPAIHPSVAACFVVVDTSGRFYGLRGHEDATTRRILDAWLAFTADASIRDLTLDECEDAESHIVFVPDTTPRFARLLRAVVSTKPAHPEPLSGTWWVRSEIVDALAERIALREEQHEAARSALSRTRRPLVA